MKRRIRLALAAGAMLALLVGASPVAAASDGAAYGDHIAQHARDMRGFNGDCNPGTHQGFSGWPGGCAH